MTALPRGETPGPSAEDHDTTAVASPTGTPPETTSPAPGTAPDPEATASAGPADPIDGADARSGPGDTDHDTDTGTESGAATGGDPASREGDEGSPSATAPVGTEIPEAPEGTGGSEAPEGTGDGGGEAATDGAVALSEAEAELAAQRELRERIEKRKAEKEGPIPAGTKLSGTAADLLAAVRAVESGEKTATAFFDSPSAPAPTAAAAAAPRRASPPVPAQSRPGSSVARTVTRGPSADAVAAVSAVLTEGGAPVTLAGAVAGTLGERSADLLRADPWQLLSVPGVRPEQADGFARALLGAECGPDDERRTAALVGLLLERAALRGHTAMDASAVRAGLAERAVSDPDAAVRHAVAEGVVLVFQDGAEPAAPAGASGDGSADAPDADGQPSEPVQVLLGLDRYALAEESLADGLARLVNACAPYGDDPAWERAAETVGSPSAAELVRAVATAGVVCHTGGEAARAEPAALLSAAHGLGLRALGTTHSVDGRRRLAEAIGDPSAAVTLSGLLSGTEGPGRDEEGAFALDLLVVLDAPQLDVESAAMLIESLADGARLVLSGDPAVLGSAGAGRVFGDVLAARTCPRVTSRTPDPGPIGELVSGIGIGELEQVAAPGKEVVIVPVREAGEAVHRTVQLVADSVPRAIGVPPADTQVITVGHGGAAGTRALNTALKQRLNPGPGRFGGFDPGDRVVHIPAPGRTVPGAVVSADAEGLHLDCAGTPVVVPQERVESSVRHGWALSAHQAAGMRWPAVVVVLPGDAAQGLSRPWVYTAFSRGERHLSVVHGVDQALPLAVAQTPSEDRTTRLRTLLETSAASAAVRTADG
ncbi:helix-hairpin-helix domain-containing protein [Streptomyces sp. AM 4-1-1]|uniref:helix-hairpin-helix domain-containing protein n=1 Tax=Streptomyces sp. AM 4-1-1 TaxID=3028710 RepID=UPI0023BA341E|nr:helix-hairpin-helix domain-containing protein [Streptomyces sp. AM 4-1-1]WEH32651.1 helix-hairpin-helix domain-containing protein [Streptomyces sp. AM 4-1-1]